MAKRKTGDKPKPPKGCKLNKQHSSKKAAEAEQKRLHNAGRNSRIITRKPKGKVVYYTTDCGKKK
ncbi:hypothetical protein [Aureispira sp. CCB-E]|uniref:hypothetical protein n=1 Tax=Aureispira sp. CCB-E TaxID=3051121 RepID=UPI002868BBF4|nr:hypothetical protein [Aureispira sp. CCB-E]WMX12297.1 hypothetical protein QP953_15825 [Aureispira sp. CCB-E]